VQTAKDGLSINTDRCFVSCRGFYFYFCPLSFDCAVCVCVCVVRLRFVNTVLLSACVHEMETFLHCLQRYASYVVLAKVNDRNGQAFDFLVCNQALREIRASTSFNDKRNFWESNLRVRHDMFPLSQEIFASSQNAQSQLSNIRIPTVPAPWLVWKIDTDLLCRVHRMLQNINLSVIFSLMLR